MEPDNKEDRGGAGGNEDGGGPKGRLSQTEPKVQTGQCPTKVEPEGRGSLVELYGRWFPGEPKEGGARVELMCRQATEAGGGDRRYSVLDGAGGLKTLSRSSQHVGHAEGLKDSSKSGAEELTV